MKSNKRGVVAHLKVRTKKGWWLTWGPNASCPRRVVATIPESFVLSRNQCLEVEP